MILWKMNWQGHERKCLWPNMKYTCLEEVRKTTGIFSMSGLKAEDWTHNFCIFAGFFQADWLHILVRVMVPRLFWCKCSHPCALMELWFCRVPKVIKSFKEAVLNVVNILLPVVISVYCTTYLAYRKASCRLEYVSVPLPPCLFTFLL